MANIEYLNYDENVDHLVIHKTKEKIVSSINTGLSIISFNDKKEIVGLEFMGANKNFSMPFEVLKNLTGCRVDIRYNPNKKFLVINLLLKHNKREAPLVHTYENMDLGKLAYNQTLTSAAV